MGTDSTTKSVCRNLVELSAARPPVHSFNRQFVRLLLDATGALAATLWLVEGEELRRSEEIEQSVGAIQSIQLSEQQQQQALRSAYEGGQAVVLENRPEGFDPLLAEETASRRVVFVPIVGPRGSFGVIRLIFRDLPEGILTPSVQLAEVISGYYTLYAAQRALEVQHRERQDIDRLSKAILQLQHFTFSRSLPEVVVNSALEVTPQLDRAALLTADKTGELSVAAVSSVSEPGKKTAWAKLLRELGDVVLQCGETVQFIAGVTDPANIDDPELREYVNSYVVMTEASSLLIFPLRFDELKVGVIVFEAFNKQPLSAFEMVLCTVFAAHVGSALANHQEYRRIPFSRLFARGLDEAAGKRRRGRFGLSTATRIILIGVLAAAVIWFVGLRDVPQTVGADCFVASLASRVVTARVGGEIESVHFRHGERVQESQVLIRQNPDRLELEIERSRRTIEAIQMRIDRLRAEAARDIVPEEGGTSLLAGVKELEHAKAAEELALEIWHQRLKDSTLLSPISGTVIGPEYPEEMLGMVVSPGEPLCEIGHIAEKVRVRIAVPEADAPKVSADQEVEIRLQSLLTQEVITGRIARVAQRSLTYQNTNVFIADVIVENRSATAAGGAEGELLLMPGMTGKARITIRGTSTYLKIYAGLLKEKIVYWLF